MDTFQPQKYLALIRRELVDNVIPFWLTHSLDRENGGYYNCLSREGQVYDSTKHMWLQCREVWMFSRLYNRLEKNESWLEAARLGAAFILAHGRNPEGRVYFSLTAEGRPLFIQRKVFAECFYSLALDEYGRATGEPELRAQARELFSRVVQWAADPGALGRPVLEGRKPASELAVPMMLLCTAEQLADDTGGSVAYKDLTKKCVAEIMLHVLPEEKIVLENVAPDGSPLAGSQGRLLNPGHAIEAGWFMLEWALKAGDRKVRDLALSMIDWSFEKGWDREHGGIFYFLDAGGHSPVQLEWFMKLWWPHCEALYGLLLAWRETGEQRFAQGFELVADYAFKHFSDPDYGEWFGYLDRQGQPTHTFKGGPYKGFFHVPRALFLCLQLLEKLP